MANKTAALETRLKAAEGMALLIGETPAMQQVRRLIDTIAPTDASVMILGETGTGKEVVARSLHEKSRRADRAFIPVNCGASQSERAIRTPQRMLTETQPQGTLPGRQRRHALPRRVGELDRRQVKALAFLESGEIRRVGETSRSASTSAFSARPIATSATWSPMNCSARHSSGSTFRSICRLCACSTT
jgi:transcriptional regulator of aromatic amino acid metabolism